MNIALYNKNIKLFAIEGILISLVNNLIINNNSLFATRLGANNFELSLVIALPQFVGMLVLIPGGILTDRMPNKRRMVVTALACLVTLYMLIGFVPSLGTYSLKAFLILLALSLGPLTIYNASWQAYFSDVITENSRNYVLTIRTYGIYLVNIFTPLVTGNLLSRATNILDKIRLHQRFFWTAGILLIIQIFVLKRIHRDHVLINRRISIGVLKDVIRDLAHNRRLLGFIAVAIFFYMTWHADWTLYYIGQVYYLKLNEAWMSYVSIGAAIMQLLTLRFWSHVNEKMGVRFGIIIGNIGLACCSLSIFSSIKAPGSMGPVLFVVLMTLSNFSFATVTLNIVQCLLQVVPEKNKTLSIAIYTVLVSLSNAVMPMVGVGVYNMLGADRHAYLTTYSIIFIFRLVSISLWIMRWWLLRNEPK